MPFKQYSVPLRENCYVAVEFHTQRGQVTGFVIRLMRHYGACEYCVARYDTAHGEAHRDLVNPSGKLIQKDWLGAFDFSQALDHAIEDFKVNHATYIDHQEKTRPKEDA